MSDAVIVELHPDHRDEHLALVAVTDQTRNWSEADKQRYWAEMQRLASEHDNLDVDSDD